MSFEIKRTLQRKRKHIRNIFNPLPKKEKAVNSVHIFLCMYTDYVRIPRTEVYAEVYCPICVILFFLFNGRKYFGFSRTNISIQHCVITFSI